MRDNMNIVITGACSNIAYKVAQKLSDYNKVYLTVHTEAQLLNLKEKINNPNIEIYKLDITNKEDYKILDDIDIDVFIAHAAVGIGGSVLALETDFLRYNYEVNVFSNIELIKYVYQKMEKKNSGKIFVMSSLLSMMPIVMLESYTSSKAALSNIVISIKKELKITKSNIKISLIEPGAYKTGFNQVMIDNKDNYLNVDTIFYKNREIFTEKQRKIFKLLERKNIDGIVNKIVKEVDRKNPKFKIRTPFLQVFLIKIYLLMFR